MKLDKGSFALLVIVALGVTAVNAFIWPIYYNPIIEANKGQILVLSSSYETLEVEHSSLVITHDELIETNVELQNEIAYEIRKGSLYRTQLNSIQAMLDSRDIEYANLVGEYNALIDIRDTEYTEYVGLIGEYNSLVDEYNELGAELRPSRKYKLAPLLDELLPFSPG